MKKGRKVGWKEDGEEGRWGGRKIGWKEDGEGGRKESRMEGRWGGRKEDGRKERRLVSLLAFIYCRCGKWMIYNLISSKNREIDHLHSSSRLRLRAECSEYKIHSPRGHVF